MLWPWHPRDFPKAIAAIIDWWRTLVVLALEVECLLVEAGQKQSKLFLKQLAVFLRVEQRCAECLDLTSVISAANPHDDTTIGDNVGHRVVFCQPNRMPHWKYVEGATKFQALGLSGEPEAELDQIRKYLVALALEMMLGRPQHVETEFIHELRDLARGVESLAQPLVRIAPVIRRSAV